MAPRPESHTAVMSDSLNLSTSTAFALSLTSTGVNSSQMSRSLNNLNSPAMKPCYWSTSFDGLVTYPEWRTTASLRRSSMVNSPLAIVTGTPKKCYKDCLKEVSQCVSHRLPAMVWHGRWQRRLAPHSPQGCFTVWREPERLPQRQTTEEESSSCFHHWKHRPDLYVPTLHEDLPVSHQPPQSRMGLQSVWTTTFLIFIRKAKPNK